MLVGFIVLSAAVGMVAMGATIALDLPTWITLAAYPTIGSLTLLISAALWNIRSNAPVPQDRLVQQPSHG